MVGCKDYVHAQMGRKGNEQRRIFRQIVRKTSRILDNFYFFQPCPPPPPTPNFSATSIHARKLKLCTDTH